MRVAAGIAGPGVGPGAALVVSGAGGLAGLVAVAALQFEILVVAAEAVDRGFDGAVARFDHAGAAHPGDAANVLHPRRHAVLQPAHRAVVGIGRIVEAPGATAAVALAGQRAIGGVTRRHRRVQIVSAGTVEIGLRQCRARDGNGRQDREHHHTRPKEAAYPHDIAFKFVQPRASRGASFERHEPVRLMNGAAAAGATTPPSARVRGAGRD